MKKIMIAIMLSFAMAWSFSAMAETVGIVDMQTIFKTSSKAKAINQSLKNKFSARKESIVQMGKALQADIQKYQKNQSVMDKKSLQALQEKISKQNAALREAQTKFQTDLMAEQNKEMKAFVDIVKSAVEKVAAQKKLDIVLPNNAVLFSEKKLDVTSSVLAAMK